MKKQLPETVKKADKDLNIIDVIIAIGIKRMKNGIITNPATMLFAPAISPSLNVSFEKTGLYKAFLS